MRPANRSEGGFAVPALAVVTALVLLALTGVSVDLWRVVAAHRRLAAVADAAAVAGAGAIDVDALYADRLGPPILDRTGAEQRACAYLVRELRGAVCPGPLALITVDRESVTVQARSRVSLSLLRLLLVPAGEGGDVEVAATATAVAIRVVTTEG